MARTVQPGQAMGVLIPIRALVGAWLLTMTVLGVALYVVIAHCMR